jgi:uncharacterized protein (TIGR02246 family)
MRIRTLLPAALCLAFISGLAGGQTQPPSDAASRRSQEIVDVIARWTEAVRDRDVRVLEQVFDDDAIITTMDGKTRGKAGELEAYKPNPNVRTLSAASEDVAIKLFGDVVVVTGLTKMRVVNARNSQSRLAMRYTAVLVRKDGQWKIVVLQTARAPQPV